MNKSSLEAGEAISPALIAEVAHEGVRMPNRALILIECFDQDGEKSFIYYQTKGTETWDALGMMEMAKHLMMHGICEHGEDGDTD